MPIRHAIWILVLVVLVAASRSDAQAAPHAPRADTVAIALQYLARLRAGVMAAEHRGEPAWPDSLVSVQVALGGRAGSLLRDSLATRPLYLIGRVAPERSLLIDSLVFRDTIAALYTTSTGRSAQPGPWWENVTALCFRWDANTGEWRLFFSGAMRATDGHWSPPRSPRGAG